MKELYATLDLGSNSFHMLIAAFEYGEIRVVESISEKVMLAEDMTKEAGISLKAQQRGVECIKRFAQRMESIPTANIRVIGTNTLRAASNANSFLEKIQPLLGEININIISGIEEARLIFLGVSHSWSSLDPTAKHLVIDIGGGSTEFIIGKPFKPVQADSLRMGCVAYRRFFKDGCISRENFEQAVRSAGFEVANIISEYEPNQWDNVIGSAGTFKAIERLSTTLGFTEEGFTEKSLKQIKKLLLSFSIFDKLDVPGLKRLRGETILPGLAIATAIFKQLEIKKMYCARGGLREGALYELVGESRQVNIKERSIQSICKRYKVSNKTQSLLTSIKNHLLTNSQNSLLTSLTPSDNKNLSWAVNVAKIGLTINHSQYQQHSAYLIENTELSGFSLMHRRLLSQYVLNHRRKINLKFFLDSVMNRETRNNNLFIILVLRLTYIFGQNQKKNGCQEVSIQYDGKFILTFSTDWASSHPLVHYALEKEVKNWIKMPVKLALVKK